MSQAKNKFYCLNPVRHDGKRYASKAEIELTADEAKPLLAAHAITKHNPEKRVDAEAEAKAKADEEVAKRKAADDAKAKAEAEAKAKAGK